MPTADLVEAEPDLAIELGVHESSYEALTPVEQEIDQNVRSLEELLTRIAWPSTVVGVVAVVERVPHRLPDNPHNARYLATKRDRAGHFL